MTSHGYPGKTLHAPPKVGYALPRPVGMARVRPGATECLASLQRSCPAGLWHLRHSLPTASTLPSPHLLIPRVILRGSRSAAPVRCEGPRKLDELLSPCDMLPHEIRLTPIMRPYLIKGHAPDRRGCVGAMAVTAGSRISLRVVPEQRQACFDLFACRHFDTDSAIPRIKAKPPGKMRHRSFVGGPSRDRSLSADRPEETASAKNWLRAVHTVNGESLHF